MRVGLREVCVRREREGKRMVRKSQHGRGKGGESRKVKKRGEGEGEGDARRFPPRVTRDMGVSD